MFQYWINVVVGIFILITPAFNYLRNFFGLIKSLKRLLISGPRVRVPAGSLYRMIFLNRFSLPLKEGYFRSGSNHVGVFMMAF